MCLFRFVSQVLTSPRFTAVPASSAATRTPFQEQILNVRGSFMDEMVVQVILVVQNLRVHRVGVFYQPSRGADQMTGIGGWGPKFCCQRRRKCGGKPMESVVTGEYLSRNVEIFRRKVHVMSVMSQPHRAFIVSDPMPGLFFFGATDLVLAQGS